MPIRSQKRHRESGSEFRYSPPSMITTL